MLHPGREDLDLSSPDAIKRAVEGLSPDAIINAAAYTAVDRAESEPEIAFALNRDAPATLARCAQERGIPLVHISTDYVFNGEKSEPYTETDAIAPLGVYGHSKAQAETLVMTSCPRAAIVRTSWVFSPHGANFVKTMLRLAGQREELGVVADQRGRPTAATDIARTCVVMTERLLAEDGSARGIFHFAGHGDTTWAEFAEAIFEGARRRGLPAARVRHITTADYPTPAKRPANSRLDTSKIESIGIEPRPWPIMLEECLDQLN